MNKLNLLTAAAVAALAFAGCTGVQASTTDTAPAGSNQGSSAPAAPGQVTQTPSDGVEADGATEASDPESSESGVAAFGEAYTWEDGIAVTVSTPKHYKPSEWAAGTDSYNNFVSFEIRVVNKTDKTWDPALFHASVQSYNEEGEQVFDSERLKEMPQTKLLKGREAKFTVAYGVANPKDLVMEVNPDFEHESVLFQK